MTTALPHELERGDRFEGSSSILSHRFLGSSEVLAAVRGQLLEERVIVGAALITRWTLEPGPDGTTLVTHSLDVEFPRGPLGGLARWVLARRLAKLQSTGLDRLADALDQT